MVTFGFDEQFASGAVERESQCCRLEENESVSLIDN
jgi:hypothetical protein